MNIAFLFPLAGILSLIASLLVWRPVLRKEIETMQAQTPQVQLLLGGSILLTMGALIGLNPVTSQGINMTLASSVGLATLIVQLIHFYGIVRHGIQGLGLFILPATALPLLVVPWLPEAHAPNWVQTRSILEDTHLLISMIGYAVLTLAAVHALMFLLVDRALKRKRLGGLVQALPPLSYIDRHMYAQVRGATWLIGISILTGLSWQWVSYEHFALLNHKVLLALFSFGVLLLLLLKHKRHQWPGRTSSKVILAAYGLMVLAYFGVKFILSWLH